MSGHSKWATIKHKKGAADKARGKLFAKLIKQVEVAARQGGGDPDANATLRTMFHKARENSVPLDTIERAIKRGTGELEGVDYEEITYEGYAPGGIAMYIEALTDNRNRTGPEIKTLLSRTGGSIAEPGSVAWQFERKGVIAVAGTISEDEIVDAALEAGAEDVARSGEIWNVITEPSEINDVRENLEATGIVVKSGDLVMVPSTVISLDTLEAAKSVLTVIEALEENDDVQDVYANFDIDDDIMAQL